MIDYVLPRYQVRRDARSVGRLRHLRARMRQRRAHRPGEGRGAQSRSREVRELPSLRARRGPARALSIARWPQVDGGSAVWTLEYMQDIAKQASSGGVLLSSMGNPEPYPVYWDHLLLNASQVTNPSIDPLREPMETRVFFGRPSRRARGADERRRALRSPLPPQVKLDVPIMFSAMSFGSVSLNTQRALAMAACELGTLFNVGEGGLHRDLERYADHAVVQVASVVFGVDPRYLNAGGNGGDKDRPGAEPASAGIFPVRRSPPRCRARA